MEWAFSELNITPIIQTFVLQHTITLNFEKAYIVFIKFIN